MIKLCHKIAVVRGGKGDWASKLLTHFSGRKAVLLGMATDAAAACCDLTRSLDAEDADISAMNGQIEHFANSIQCLFLSEKVLTLPTWTKGLCDACSREPLRILHNGVAREVVVTQEDKTYALQVMKQWVETVLKIMEAEFPSWHLLTCFDVFQLAGTSHDKKRGLGVDAALSKLAQVFEVSQKDLKAQYTSVLPSAQALQKKSGLDNRSAWAETLRRLGSRSDIRSKYPVSALKKVVASYLAWTAASSGCEQMFSCLKRSPAEIASSRQDTDRRLAVVVGSDPQFDEVVLVKARELYGSMLPSGRSRTANRQPRIDCGRQGKERSTSKQAWIRARKSAVDQAAEEETELRTPARRPPVELPESMAKESAKQTMAERKRKAEAYQENILLPEEATDEVKADAAKKAKTDAANDKDRHKKFVAVNAAVAISQRPQSQKWALTALLQPAWLQVPAQDAEGFKTKLREFGVCSFVQD